MVSCRGRRGKTTLWMDRADLWNLADTVASNCGGAIDWILTDFAAVHFDGPPEGQRAFYDRIQEMQFMVRMGEQHGE